jgi:hypothetical protein
MLVLDNPLICYELRVEQETSDLPPTPSPFFISLFFLFKAVVYAIFIPVSKDQWSLLSVLLDSL